MSEARNTTTCLICEQRPPKTSYWIYLWKGKEGHACDECGARFHDVGYYLLEAAQRTLERKGIKVAQTKEKFGRMVLYTDSVTKEQEKFVEALAALYKGMFPEYEWDFS